MHGKINGSDWSSLLAVISPIVLLRDFDLIVNLLWLRSCPQDADNVAYPPLPKGKGQAAPGMSHRCDHGANGGDERRTKRTATISDGLEPQLQT